MSIRTVSSSGYSTSSLSPDNFTLKNDTVILGKDETVKEWKRNPAWLTLTEPSESEQKIVALTAVFRDSNHMYITANGNFTIDWGNGTVNNVNGNTYVEMNYSFSDANLANTEGPVTFQGTADTVTRVNHGYANNDTISFANVVTTTGITTDNSYFVINATQNTFQLATTANGSAINLVNDGTGAILPYKQAIITITPQAGQTIDYLDLNSTRNTSITLAVAAPTGFLDLFIFGGGKLRKIYFSTTTQGRASQQRKHTYLERVKIANTAITNADNLFYNCTNLKVVDRLDLARNYSNTANVTFVSGLSGNVNWTNHNLISGDIIAIKSLSNTAAGLNVGQTYFVNVQSNNVFTISHSVGGGTPVTSTVVGDVTRGVSIEGMFYDCGALLKANLYNSFTDVLHANNAFYNNYSLQDIVAKDNVLDMTNTYLAENLFYNNYLNYKYSDEVNIDLRNARNLNNMFYFNRSLTTLSNINMASALFANNMFLGCTSLKNVSYLNSDNLQQAFSMFSGCGLLEDGPSMNTSSLQNMSTMFNGCAKLKYVPNYDSRNVSDFSSMFANCLALEKAPSLNTSNAFTMASMFSTCRSLKYVPDYDYSKCYNLSSLFTSCTNLNESININVSNATEVGSLFNGCSRIKKVSANVANARNLGSMFQGCSSLIDVEIIDLGLANSTAAMFQSCVALEKAPAMNTANVRIMSNMFNGCSSLKYIPFYDTSNNTSVSAMFNACYALEKAPAMNTANVTTFTNMFNSCYNLNQVFNYDASKVTSATSMFFNCRSLESIPGINFGAVTSSIGFSTTFSGIGLRRISANNFKYSFSVASNYLSAERLNEIYANLATTTGQTITVSNNYGAATDNTAIATAKGWTVTG